MSDFLIADFWRNTRQSASDSKIRPIAMQVLPEPPPLTYCHCDFLDENDSAGFYCVP